MLSLVLTSSERKSVHSRVYVNIDGHKPRGNVSTRKVTKLSMQHSIPFQTTGGGGHWHIYHTGPNHPPKNAKRVPIIGSGSIHRTLRLSHFHHTHIPTVSLSSRYFLIMVNE